MKRVVKLRIIAFVLPLMNMAPVHAQEDFVKVDLRVIS